MTSFRRVVAFVAVIATSSGWATFVNAAPDVSVTKTCSSTGQSAQCTVTVTNIGNVPTVSPLSITDTITGTADANLLGAGGTLPASCTPGAQLINNIPLTCPNVNTTLAPSASGTFLVSYSMPQGGNFTNCVTVTAAQNAGTPGDPNAANNTNICTAFTVASPTPATGTITIVKDAQPNDAQDFTFTSNQASIAPFPLDDDSDATLSNQRTFTVPAGAYTFTETTVSGWTLANLVCTGGTTSTNLSTATASITLAAGSNVTCTFTNSKPTTTGSITIVKDAQPNDAQNFTFTSNQAAIAPFPLDDDSDATLSNQRTFTVPAGAYTFTETTVAGWTLSTLVCTGGTTSTNVATATASITLAAGDNVTCTFTNTKLTTGKLTIIKDSQPNDGQDFHFVTAGSGLGDFDLDDDGTNANPLSNSVVFTVPAGVPLTVTEDALAAWTVPSIQCLVAVPGLTTTFTDQANRTFTVNLEAGADVTCTFINVKRTGSITIVKDAQPNDGQDFTFTSNQASIAPFPLDDDSDATLSNQRTFTVPAGAYTFTENTVAGWNLANLVCTGGTTSTSIANATASITLAAGDAVTCTFTNSKVTTASLTIIKDAVVNDAQDFAFYAFGPNSGSINPFQLDDDAGATGADMTLSNSKTFSLAPGSYSVMEDFYNPVPVTGWTLNAIACMSASGANAGTIDMSTASFTVNLAVGDNVTCIFTNGKTTTGSVTIIKDARPNDAQDFTFTSNQAGIAPFPLDDDSDATLSDRRTFATLPAGAYTFTETAVSGWNLANIVCTGGTTSANVATATASITLAAGDSVTCTFTNDQVNLRTGKICGMKFNDLDGDGVQDAADLGLPGWQITTGVASIPPVTTGTKGEYCFNDLPPGSYVLSEIPQAPWLQTFPTSPGTHAVTLQAGQTLNGYNFGNTLPAGTCSPLMQSQFNLLTNGNFEGNSVTTYQHFDASLVDGWESNSSGNDIEIWGTNFNNVPAYSGSQFIELNANGHGEIYQDVTVVAGKTYTIKFAHWGRATYPNQLSVSITAVGGTPATLGTFTATVSAWTLNTLSWTAPANGGTAYRLTFTAGDLSHAGNLVDAIQMLDTSCQGLLADEAQIIDGLHWFEFFEDQYPDTFASGVSGKAGKYTFHFYKESAHYLALDDAGGIFLMGPMTDNAIKQLGTTSELKPLLLAWLNGPVPQARVFAFAEANLPGLFKGTGTPGQYQQYSYRYYAATGNILAVDNAGMIYILGPYTGGKIRSVGSVESFRTSISTWYDAATK